MRSFRERYEAIRTQEKHPIVRERAGAPIETLQRGALRYNSAGEVFVAENRLRDSWLTALNLRDDLQPSVFMRDHQYPIRPNDLLFLDTETTGLAGGTGTHAFLVGLGFFEGDDFVLQQFFMRSPAEERSLLEELRSSLEHFRLLVTFNGKSFDWPLLDTRFLMHGYRLRFEFSHLDLLHPARRIWKHRLVSCSLTSLEQGVFGNHRTGDVPGYLIPQLYFDYLRDGDGRRLSAVFSHNREDIVTLARLLELLLAAEHDPVAQLSHAEDRVGMGLTLISSGAVDRGYRTLAGALAADGLPSDVRRRGEVELWRVMKRHGRVQDGIDMLEAMSQATTRSAVVDLFPFVELAKYYEHVARDYAQAEWVVERALRLMELRQQNTGRDDLMHRLSRIRRKHLSR